MLLLVSSLFIFKLFFSSLTLALTVFFFLGKENKSLRQKNSCCVRGKASLDFEEMGKKREAWIIHLLWCNIWRWLINIALTAKKKLQENVYFFVYVCHNRCFIKMTCKSMAKECQNISQSLTINREIKLNLWTWTPLSALHNS
jgi:hypothetical protein